MNQHEVADIRSKAYSAPARWDRQAKYYSGEQARQYALAVRRSVWTVIGLVVSGAALDDGERELLAQELAECAEYLDDAVELLRSQDR
jgi:hypothetical protein